jgi:uncharacterized cysteine cluster protein YcgN (CxxCxxCC family)
MSELPFWERKSLSEMTRVEWESLCDGCGKCCLHKLQDETSGEVHYTRVVCRYLEQKQCRCTVYTKRKKLVPTCVVMKPGELENLYFMPSTCAYRILAEGKGLPIWHPLIAGGRKAMIASDNTITGKVISEEFVHEDGLEEHVVHWVK